MAIFNPTNVPVISKLKIGEQTYYLKDAEARELLKTLGTAAKKDVAAGVSAEEQGLVTGAQVQAAIAGISGSMHFRGVVASFDDITNPAAGDVIIIGIKEYVYGGEPAAWHELGEEGVYALKTVTIGTQNLSANINLDTLAADMGLGKLAKKDSATGTVAGQTISGVKATGTVTGSVAVALTQTATDATVTKKDYTPAGTVTGSVTATGNVATEISAEATAATLTRGDYTPTGNVTVTPATGSIEVIDSVGTAASKAADTFNGGTAASFTQGSKASWSASVDDTETLSFSFTPNGDDTFKPNTVATFTEGKFTPNTLPTKKTASVVTGIASAAFSGTKETGLKVTGVNYDKVTGATSTFTGTAADIAAEFAGTVAKDALVDTIKYNAASVNAEGTTFTADAVSLNVGDIVVSEKQVTVQ